MTSRLKSQQSYYLHHACEGVNLYLWTLNFSAQEHASSKSWHILNLRVMAVRDIKLWTCFSKKYLLISGFLAFSEVNALGKVLTWIFAWSVQIFSGLDSQTVSSRIAYTISNFRPPCWCPFGGTLIAAPYPRYAGLCKFVRNISTNIWRSGKRTVLELGEVSYLSLITW